MAGPSWLVDGNRIATKIRNASGAGDPGRVKWKSNPTKACPSCLHIIDNRDVAQEWPGLPRGVKFDPTDQEIMWHLLAKAGLRGLKPHPFIDEFIPTVDRDDGICYTHPQNLPGVKHDGSVAHFFHRAIKAYSTGTRKRRKIIGDDLGEVRWHKTGRTKPVVLDGVQEGCKKIMVLYMSMARGGKAEKTSWVMHQYHLGVEEDEKDGDYVISKIFYQQQQSKLSDKIGQDVLGSTDAIISKVDPNTPNTQTPDPPCAEWRPDFESPSTDALAQPPEITYEEEFQRLCESSSIGYHVGAENDENQMLENNDDDEVADEENQKLENNGNDNHVEENREWWDSESQHLLNSQQLAEVLTLCDGLLHSQSQNDDGIGNYGISERKHGLSDYAKLGGKHLKDDLEECQNLAHDPANTKLDSPPEVSLSQLDSLPDVRLSQLDSLPDVRLSQLEFGSQDSFLAFGGNKRND